MKDDPELKKALEAACKGGLSKEGLGKLSEACKGNSADLKKMLNRLCNAGLCREPGSESDGARGISERELLKFLRQNAPGCQYERLSMCMTPETGGTSRGPGPAPLTQGTRDTEFARDFKNEALESGGVDIKHSTLVGTSLSAPETAPGGGSRPGAARAAPGGAGDDLTAPVEPRHQRVVREYFQRKSEKQ